MVIKRSVKKKNTARKRTNKNWVAQIKKWFLRFIIGFFVVTITWVLLLIYVNPPLTYLQLKRAFERKSIGKGWKIDKAWLPYTDISDNLKRAAIAGEDAYFMRHNGFDMKAIQKAIKRNQTSKSLRGGSTISQQVAKNVFLWPKRSWLRKGLEVYFTILIEAMWSKKRILEVYLNVIEMGQGVYGAEAAAQYYFYKSAKSLSRKEAALIIAILPNPQKWDAKRPSVYVNRRANSIVRYMSHYSIP